VATLLKNEIGIEPQLLQGRMGEFSVWLDGKLIVKKGWLKIPSDERVLEAVQNALQS
jgi:hypothetical protein